ncbi:MAG: DUF748 domain-containing protein [Burkholderiales bacterium]|nr:DUF748 domain-containing protein [Burkholderiales bacterium]
MARGPIDLGVAARTAVRSRRLRKTAWWILGIVAFIAVAGFLVAPPIVKSLAEKRLTALLGREVTIERVAINPFVLSAKVAGLAVKPRAADAPDSGPLFAFEELYARLSYASIARFAPVIGEIRLVRPELHLVRRTDRSYNVQDLIDALLGGPPAEEGPPARYSVNNAQLIDGRVTLDDRPEQKRHEVTGINLNVPALSSLDVHVDRFVEPKLEAVINGHPLRVVGETKPFQDSLETRLSADLSDVDLPRYLDYSPVELAFTLPSGRLDATIELAFVQAPGKGASLTVRGDAWARELALADRAGREVLGFRQLHVRVRSLDAFGRKAVVERVALDGPRLDVERAKDGRLNLLALLPRGDAAAAPADAPPFAFEIAEVAVTDGAATVADLAPEPPFRRAIRDLRIQAKDLSNAPDRKATVEIQFDSTPGPAARAGNAAGAEGGREPARFVLAGEVGLVPGTASGTIELTNLQLASLHPYFAAAVDGQIRSGRADASARFDLSVSDGEAAGRIGGITVTLSDVALHQSDAKTPMLRLASASVTDGEADLAARTIVLGQVKLDQPAVRIAREPDGRVDAQRILRAVEAGDGAAAPAAGPDEAPWTAEIRKLAVDAGSVAFEDRSVRPAVKVTVGALSVDAEGISTAKGAQGTGSVRARINRSGTLAVKGEFSRALSAKLALDLRNLDLAPFEAYVKPHVAIDIPRGRLSARGTVEVDAADAPKAAYRGDLALQDVAVAAEGAEGELLRWESLRLAGIGAATQPLRVDIEEVALERFFSRLVLDASGELNLQRLARGRAGATAPAAKPAAQPAAARTSDQVAAAQASLAEARQAVDWLRVGRVRLADGNVDFSDFFVKPNYSANLTDLEGTVSTLTFEQPGELALRGRLDRTAPLEISGRINPLAADLLLDLKAAARDIELSPLTPYSVRYLGYGIEKGKLSVNVEYLVENRKLSAKNNIRLDQLTFGEKVESPDATDLPVLMAVSLLKDKQGVIDVDLPIGGSLDDPEFSVGGIVLRVIFNIIAKAVTAPFALLGSIAGGAELDHVDFAPGRAALDAQARDKLAKLAQALDARPALKLDIVGRADPAVDREGLKRAALERAVKQEKYESLRGGEGAPKSVDAVTIDPKEYPALLERAYADADIPDKPRNILGFAKDIPVAEMENLMLAAAPADDEALRRLAAERAQAARNHLVEEGRIAAERLFLVAPRVAPADAKEKDGGARIDFALK